MIKGSSKNLSSKNRDKLSNTELNFSVVLKTHSMSISLKKKADIELAKSMYRNYLQLKRVMKRTNFLQQI